MSRKYMFYRTMINKFSYHYYRHHHHRRRRRRRCRHYYRHPHPVQYYVTCVTYTCHVKSNKSQSRNNDRLMESRDVSSPSHVKNLIVLFLISVPAVALNWIMVC